MSNLPPRPKDGSRKAEIFDIYFKSGLEAAQKKAAKIDIKSGTVRSWVGVWDRQKNGKLVVKPKPEKVERVRLEKKPPEKEQGFVPHFKYTSRAGAENGIKGICNRNHMSAGAFHVLEYQERFAIAPIHHANVTPVPIFIDGDTVHDLTIKDSEAIVVKAGPEQSIIRYAKDHPFREREPCVINRYLFKLETPAKPAKSSKRERLTTPKKKGKTK